MLAIVVRYDDQPELCEFDRTLQLFDRSVAIVVSHVEIAVKPGCHAPTMLSPRRKDLRAAEPK